MELISNTKQSLRTLQKQDVHQWKKKRYFTQLFLKLLYSYILGDVTTQILLQMIFCKVIEKVCTKSNDTFHLQPSINYELTEASDLLSPFDYIPSDVCSREICVNKKFWVNATRTLALRA